MKNVLFAKILILLLSLSNCKFLRFLQSQSMSTNSYDYSSISYKSTNENLSSKTLEATAQDQSVVYITKSGISITNSNLKIIRRLFKD